jgi:hypothetical protein
MGKKEISKVIKSFDKSYLSYKASFERFNKMDEKTRDKITKQLVWIDSKHSVEIEERSSLSRPKYERCHSY